MSTKPTAVALILAAWLLLPASHARAKGPDSSCLRDETAQAWLEAGAKKWDRRLAGEEGYEKPEAFEVCLTRSGVPHVDYTKNRIFLRRVEKSEDMLTLVHEYLHLAFKHHPRARDELFIENTARTLLLDEER